MGARSGQQRCQVHAMQTRRQRPTQAEASKWHCQDSVRWLQEAKDRGRISPRTAQLENGKASMLAMRPATEQPSMRPLQSHQASRSIQQQHGHRGHGKHIVPGVQASQPTHQQAYYMDRMLHMQILRGRLRQRRSLRAQTWPCATATLQQLQQQRHKAKRPAHLSQPAVPAQMV